MNKKELTDECEKILFRNKLKDMPAKPFKNQYFDAGTIKVSHALLFNLIKLYNKDSQNIGVKDNGVNFAHLITNYSY